MYSSFSFSDFVLCLGYRGQMIKDYFLQYHAMNHDFTLTLGREKSIEFHDVVEANPFTVTLAETGLATMTGGRVLRVSKYITDKTFMMTYGDGVSNINIAELVRFHESHGKLATITVTHPVSRFGMVDVDKSGAVDRFVEKPTVDSWASAGFFVLDRKVFDYLDGDDCIFEQQPLERLAADNQLVAFRHEGFFFAMDTYREVLQLNQLWERNEAPWRVW
jgi:glucose-1-phosphate cytidylyltransferase